jgi:hypothetical protein
MKLASWPCLVGFVVASAVLADEPPTGSVSPTPIAQEPIQGIVYHPRTPAAIRALVAPVPVNPFKIGTATAEPDVAAAQQNPAVQMDTFNVSNRPDRTARDLGPALGKSPLLAPRALYTKDLDHGLRLDAFCAPISPLTGENAGGMLQARFPLVSLAW